MLIGAQSLTWDADELVAAARPLRADGSAPTRFIVSTGSSRNSLIGLDARGRMVRSSVSGITYGIHAMCPGGRRLLAWRAGGRSDVLTVSGLRIVRRGPGLTLGPTERVADASCLDPRGRQAAVVQQDAFERSRVLAPGLDRKLGINRVQLEGDRILQLRSDRPVARVIDLTRGRTVWRQALPNVSADFALSPDGRRVAMIFGRRIYVSTIGASVAPAGPIARGTSVSWAATDRLLVDPSGASATVRLTTIGGHLIARLPRSLKGCVVQGGWCFAWRDTGTLWRSRLDGSLLRQFEAPLPGILIARL